MTGNTTRKIFSKVFLKNHPLSTQLFVFSAILVIIPMLLLGIIAYYWAASILEDEAQSYSRQVIDQVKTHIEYYVRDFEIETLKMANHPDMIEFLSMRNHEEAAQSDIRRQIEDLVRNTAYSRPDISNVSVIVDNVRVIDAAGLKSPYPASELRHEYWYSQVPADGVPLLVSRVIAWPDHSEPVLSLIKRIHSPSTLEPVGLLIIDINFRRIQEIAEKFNTERRSFYILDSEGHYVYHPDLSKLGKIAEIPPQDLTRLLNSANGSYLTAEDDTDLLVFSHSNQLGWRFVASIPYSELQAGAAVMGQIITWTTVVTLALAYLLGIGFATTVIRPIRRLQQFMRRVENGEFTAKVQVDSEDEIGQLSAGFNKMTDKLAAMMEEVYFSRLRATEAQLRQREMELKVLQSQINPHFLGNSLETIRGMALERADEDIAAMAAALSQLLRYNLRHDSVVVKLREEIKFCELYLQIQKFRFGNVVDYSIDIPAWAQEQPIAKFTLQPLVENAFKHGAGGDRKAITINITAEEVANGYLVRVSDTGVGISPAILSAINTDFAQTDVPPRGTKIGLVNVHRRIVNLFGPNYGVSLASVQGRGSEITVRLPLSDKSVPGEAV